MLPGDVFNGTLAAPQRQINTDPRAVSASYQCACLRAPGQNIVTAISISCYFYVSITNGQKTFAIQL